MIEKCLKMNKLFSLHLHTENKFIYGVDYYNNGILYFS